MKDDFPPADHNPTPEARALVNGDLVHKLNHVLFWSLGITGTITVTYTGIHAGWHWTDETTWNCFGLIFIGSGTFFLGILLGFLFSTFGAEESRFSSLVSTITTLITGALAADLTRLHHSVAYSVLQVLARASGLPPDQAVGVVLMVSISFGTIGFLLMYFNRWLLLNGELQLARDLVTSRLQVQRGGVDPSPDSNKVSPETLKAAQEIVRNPLAGKSTRPGDLITDAKAFYAVGNFDKAYEVASKALALRPNDPQAMLFQASSLLGDGKNPDEEKIAEATRILEQFQPETAPLLVNKLLGYCYLFAPPGDAGQVKLKRSVELTQSYLSAQSAKHLPKDQEAVLNLACTYGQLGDQDNAFPLLKELIGKDPSIAPRLLELPDFKAWRDDPKFNDIVRSRNPSS